MTARHPICAAHQCHVPINGRCHYCGKEETVSGSEHNHVTRDVKPFGVCPACDRYYACTCRNGPRVYPDAPPAHDVSCWYPARSPR